MTSEVSDLGIRETTKSFLKHTFHKQTYNIINFIFLYFYILVVEIFYGESDAHL